ncbi:hypothetical protein EDC96DRAFT_33495 [Choanephora cucurbitarum]|nr:hypothetical protein EDC96DRAFT_33495 [Choanephora cucurbitarum]
MSFILLSLTLPFSLLQLRGLISSCLQKTATISLRLLFDRHVIQSGCCTESERKSFCKSSKPLYWNVYSFFVLFSPCLLLSDYGLDRDQLCIQLLIISFVFLL